MVRAPFYGKDGLKKGAWSHEEDEKLRAYVQNHGHPNWRELPKLAGEFEFLKIKYLNICIIYIQFLSVGNIESKQKFMFMFIEGDVIYKLR